MKGRCAMQIRAFFWWKYYAYVKDWSQLAMQFVTHSTPGGVSIDFQLTSFFETAFKSRASYPTAKSDASLWAGYTLRLQRYLIISTLFQLQPTNALLGTDIFFSHNDKLSIEVNLLKQKLDSRADPQYNETNTCSCTDHVKNRYYSVIFQVCSRGSKKVLTRNIHKHS